MNVIANNKYRYMMFYGAKSGCTSMRTLFLALHGEELSDEGRSKLREYHNLNEVFPYDAERDYRGYYKFYISRNPYGRVVSAFVDQYAMAQNEGVHLMLSDFPPTNKKPETFLEMLEYLKTVPDYARDSHFQTQRFFPFPKQIRKKRHRFERSKDMTLLDYCGDISGFDSHMRAVYKQIFKKHPAMYERLETELAQMKRMNSTYYSGDDFPDAANLSTDELLQVLAPRPQLFFKSEKVRNLVKEIYAEDFALFDYDPEKLPNKKMSPELASIPNDFNWETYLLLGPDLQIKGIDNEAKALRHYIEFGQYESDRFYKIEAPEGFDWRRYLNLHDDLSAAGIDNERDAIIHYLSFGFREGRET